MVFALTCVRESRFIDPTVVINRPKARSYQFRLKPSVNECGYAYHVTWLKVRVVVAQRGISAKPIEGFESENCRISLVLWATAVSYGRKCSHIFISHRLRQPTLIVIIITRRNVGPLRRFSHAGASRPRFPR